MLVSELYPCLICGFKGLETIPFITANIKKHLISAPAAGLNSATVRTMT